ncbi:Alanine racemase, biosynthetic [Escherichia coli]|nr:alanine racemase [Escherichia coli]VCY27499.1 Alanine racemase, biosynthetic [Escherichia coli]
MQAATVVINRRALRHNLQRLRELALPVKWLRW